MTVPVLEVFMYKESLKIQTHLCRKFEVRVPKKHLIFVELLHIVVEIY